MSIKRFIIKVVDAWPGKRYFGEYRFLPIFFFGGAFIEFLMIKWKPNGVNFYGVYKKKRIEEILELKLQQKQVALNN